MTDNIVRVKEVAEIATPKLAHLGTSIIFDLRNTRVNNSKDHSIRGKVPVVDGVGTEVMTLTFNSTFRTAHFSASLNLPNGNTLIDLNMGTETTVSSDAAQVLFSVMGISKTLKPPPPVQLHVLGQPYGWYTVTGCMNHESQAGARWILEDNTGEVLIDQPLNKKYCFCIPSGEQGVSRRNSTLGKKEVPMPVRMGTPAVKTATIHLVTDPKEGDKQRGVATNIRQVVCELDENLPKLRTLDVICMAASLAVLNVTTRFPKKK